MKLEEIWGKFRKGMMLETKTKTQQQFNSKELE